MIGAVVAAIGRQIFPKPAKLSLVEPSEEGTAEGNESEADMLRQLNSLIAACECTVARSEEVHNIATAELERDADLLATARLALDEADRAFASEDTDANAYALSIARERVPRATQRHAATAAKQEEAAQNVRSAHAALKRAKEAADRFEKMNAITAEKFHAKVAPYAARMLAALDEAELWATQIDIEFNRSNLIAYEIGEARLPSEHLVTDVLRILAERGATVPERAWRIVRECLTRPLVGDVTGLLTDSFPSWPDTPQMWHASLSRGIKAGGLWNLFVRLPRTLNADELAATRDDLDLMSRERVQGAVERRNQSRRDQEEREQRAKQLREQDARNEAQRVKHIADQQRLQSTGHGPRFGKWSMTSNPDEGWSDK